MQKNKITKIKRRALAAFMAVSVFAFMGPGLASADFMAINRTTGFTSINTVSSTGSMTFTQTSLNTELVTNNGLAVGDTGNNVSDSNTGNGTVLAGPFAALGGFSNELNLNIIEQSGAWWDGQFDAENNTTGALSTNNASVMFTNTLDIDSTNEGTMENNLTVVGNTGANSASTNTGTGSATSGSATSFSSAMNTANGNSFMWHANVSNRLFNDMAKNMTTGFDSDNNATTSLDNSLTFDALNTGSFTTDSLTVLNTGDNHSDSNTGDGLARSGNASGSQVITNEGNLNEVEVWLGGGGNSIILAINERTGANSSNHADDSISNTADVSSTNDLNISNSSTVVADSGGNTSSSNTGSGRAISGHAAGSVLIDNGNHLNHNMTTLSLDAGSAGMTSVNKTTGSGSTNTANSSLTNNVDVDNSNDADIDNDATVVSTTGDNHADNNTGNGTTSSGNASGSVAIINDANINETHIGLSGMSDMISINDTTGANSTNTATSTADNTVNVSNTNDAIITNDVTVVANSGSNTSSGNTGNGSSTSGSSTITFGVVNQSNGNSTIIH